MQGNQVMYEYPARRASRSLVVLVGLAVLLLAAAVWFLVPHAGHVIASALVVLVGLNTVTYERPVTGVTAPTSAQSRPHQNVSAIITGDGASLTFTVTHNFNISAADLSAGYPNVRLEYLLAAGYTAAATITSKTANAVVFANVAFTGAGLRVTVERPWSALK